MGLASGSRALDGGGVGVGVGGGAGGGGGGGGGGFAKKEEINYEWAQVKVGFFYDVWQRRTLYPCQPRLRGR